MAIEADEQRHQRGVDELETQIAADDIADATIVGTGHTHKEPQDDFGQETAENAQHKQQQ